MEMHSVANGVIAFVRPEGRSNCGMVFTSEGVVLVDTTARPVDMQACMDAAKVTADDVCMVLITHSHSDHTSGIPMFECPILAHRLTSRRIRSRGTERAKKQLPTVIFDNRKELNIGGVRLEIVHVGGHTPGSSVIWLPGDSVLFAGDLIFEGRYPFLGSADVEKLMDALRWLPSLGARAIVPGHGILCRNEEVLNQLSYIETTWDLTAEHIRLGNTVDDVENDPRYPICSELGREKLHSWNIRVIHQQLKKRVE